MNSRFKSALNYLKINQKPLFEVIQDSNPLLGRTLKAKRQIPKGTPVVIYYGKRLTSEENLYAYLDDHVTYIQSRAPYIRGHASPQQTDLSIDASEVVKSSRYSLNLMGVLVNDIAKPQSLSPADLQAYCESETQCNLRVEPRTKDYPLYVAKRTIKKGEILTVHYGLGYWLLQMGVPPQRISEYLDNNKFQD